MTAGHTRWDPVAPTTPPQPGRGRLGAALATATAAGLLLSAAFPPLGWWPTAILGPALFLAAARRRDSRTVFGLGTAFGAAFFGPLLWWLTNLGPAPWAALTLVQALLLGLLSLTLPLLDRLPAWPLWAAGWWVTAEAIRSRVPLGGFPWGRLAFSQADAPALGWAAAGGAPAVSAVVALAAACLAALLTAPAARRRRRRAAASLAAACAALAGGTLLTPSADGGQRADVAVVQGNVPRGRSLAEQARADRVAENHLAATRDLARDVRAGRTPRPDVVLWPENAADRDPRTDPELARGIAAVVDDLGAPVVAGALLDAPGGRLFNTSLLWGPATGPGPYYAKQHLVPFGEYVPLRGVLGGLGDLPLVPRDFVPGTGPVRLDAGPVRLAPSICYEVAYDSQVRDAVRTGANLIAVPTNNATYMRDGNLAQPEQQLAMSRLRAVEHGRSVLVAATTGVSAVITPDGTVTAATRPWTRDVLTASVPLRTRATLATRLGPIPECVVVAATVAALALAIRRRGGAGS
ncbi:apolipoprotein N-acyltransferase [Streptomyces hainanensis]|uniref:Apolipoprotein N-acyltransferase n=1 Tax=Streptomyces hainanensis TaxID=402648 RepID=A0A4R4TG16_9ACTN|nr:apolipoprotein N-acyltransferase [Streptomyces hainanensis]TDC74554.1 apolipoprotein N-acyltransferase [Streptomyces hainanensis]